MADEEAVATAGTDGAAGGTGEAQGADSGSQDSGQGQDVSQGSVDNPGENASSEGKQGRKPSSWAQERIINNAIKKQLEASLAPILERLNSNPPAPKQDESQDLPAPDFNNFNKYLQDVVGKLIQSKLAEALPPKLDGFRAELNTVSKTQEARNYLLSQEDIGQNEDRLGEIEQIMKEEMLDYAAVQQPLRAVQKAVKIWRDKHKNPNAPSKAQLSAVSGGAGAKPKKEPSVEQLRELQNKLTQPMTTEDRDKLYAEIDGVLK